MIHNSIKHFKEGEVTDSSLPPGTIITIDGQQYIVNTNIGKGNSIKQEMDNQTYILTMDVATKVSGKLPASWDEKSEFYQNQNIGRTKGSKIFYQGNYYVLNRNLTNGDYPDIGGTSNAWLQIIGT